MMTKTKKLISICFSVLLLLSIMTIVVYAYPTQSETVNINSTQSEVHSNYVVGTYKYFGGTNYPSSTKKMVITAKYYSAGTDTWYTDKKTTLAINTSTNTDIQTTVFSAATSWRVHLKPSSGSAGCNGFGYIWYS